MMNRLKNGPRIRGAKAAQGLEFAEIGGCFVRQAVDSVLAPDA